MAKRWIRDFYKGNRSLVLQEIDEEGEDYSPSDLPDDDDMADYVDDMFGYEQKRAKGKKKTKKYSYSKSYYSSYDSDGYTQGYTYSGSYSGGGYYGGYGYSSYGYKSSEPNFNLKKEAEKISGVKYKDIRAPGKTRVLAQQNNEIRPFWSDYLSKMRIVFQNMTKDGQMVSGFATDGEFIYIHPDNAKDKVYCQAAVDYCVEAIARAHHIRGAQRDPEDWIKSCNNVIVDSLASEPRYGHAEGVRSNESYMAEYKGWHEERIYDTIYTEKPKNPNGGGGDGDGDGEPQEGSNPNGPGTNANQIVQKRNADGSQMSKEQMEQALKDFRDQFKGDKKKSDKSDDKNKLDVNGDGVGSDCVNLEEYELNARNSTKRDWRNVLRGWAIDKSKPVGRTWTRLERRSLVTGVWQPDVVRDGIHWVICGVDVSGSMDEESLEKLIHELNTMKELFNFKRTTVIPFNGGILKDKIRDYSRSERITTAFHPGGGTRFDPVFDYARKQTKKPDCIIMFTDMGAELRPSMEVPGVHTMWASSEPRPWRLDEVPFGEFFYIDDSEVDPWDEQLTYSENSW